jgi:hypothetical protein
VRKKKVRRTEGIEKEGGERKGGRGKERRERKGGRGKERRERKGKKKRDDEGRVTHPVEAIFERHGRVPLPHPQHVVPQRSKKTHECLDRIRSHGLHSGSVKVIECAYEREFDVQNKKKKRGS